MEKSDKAFNELEKELIRIRNLAYDEYNMDCTACEELALENLERLLEELKAIKK